MGYVQEPPLIVYEIAANDFLFQILEPPKLAESKLISYNVKLSGTVAEQEAFKLVWSEIRGIAARALASGKPEDAKAAKIEANKAVDERILFNHAYDKFRVYSTQSDDPLMKQGY